MTRTCTTSRCAIPGPACALPTDAERAESTVVSWSHVDSSLCGHIHPSATHVPLWRINGITAVIRVGLGSAIATRRAGSVSGFWVMTQAAKAQEPSMEEILASIRRIIADDDASKPAKAPKAAPAAKQQPAVPSRPTTPPAPANATAAPPAPKPAPTPANAPANSQDDIDAMLAELDDAPADEKSSASDVFDLTEAMAAPSPPPPPPQKPAPGFRTIDGASDVVFTTKPEPPPLIDRRLISNETIAAVDSAFNTLAHTIIGQNARTLEDLVKEMLRPMLKSWLDDNLPSLVERIVRAEIERVSRGRP